MTCENERFFPAPERSPHGHLTERSAAIAERYDVLLGAEPVFVDADPWTWNIDVDLFEEELEAAAKRGERYAALNAVDL